MPTNLEKLLELFFVKVRPVTSLDDPTQLALGEAGFHFGSRVWVLKDPTTGQLVIPNRYEADLSLIAERLVNGVFTADKVGNIRLYKDLASINETLTTSNVTIPLLHTNMSDNSIIFLQVPQSSNLNNILPNTKGGVVKLSKFGSYIFGDFSANDGNRLILQNLSGSEVKWKPMADFTLIERSSLAEYTVPVVNTNNIGSIGFIARGNTARKNLIKNSTFANGGSDWTITGGTITADSANEVEITGDGSNTAIVITQEIDYSWLSYSHLISKVITKANSSNGVSFHFNDSLNTKVTVSNPNDWVTLEHDTAGLTMTTGNKVRITITFNHSSTGVANGSKCYISKITSPIVNSIYATSLKLKGIKDYNPQYNDRSSKINLTLIASNKFNKHKVTKGYKLVNGVVTVDANYFISDYITIGDGFNILNATNVAWSGRNVSNTLINGTTTKETGRNFAPNKFRFSGLISELDKILLTSKDVTNDSYEKYSESLVNVDIELKGIHNAQGSSYLYDEVYNISADGYPDKMMHIKRISDVVTINTTDIALANGTGNQYVTVPLSQFAGLKPQTSGSYDNSFFISGIEREINTGITTNGAVYAYETTATNLILAFPTGTFSSQADAAAKVSTYTLYYALATPITTELKLINTMVPSNCTIVQSYFIRTNLSYNLPVNNGAALHDMYNKIEEMSEALNNVGELGIGSGNSGGPLTETAVYTTSATLTEFNLPLLAYNPSTDYLIVYSGNDILMKDRDFKIDGTSPMRFIKLNPATGLVSSVPWNMGTVFKFIAIISNGVSNRYIIPNKYRTTFTTTETANRIPIQIPLFNPADTDILDVTQDNFNIFEDTNFIIGNGAVTHGGQPYEGYYIELTDYTAPAGTLFTFTVLKAFRSEDVIGQIDPTIIRKGITDAQLADSIKIGNVANLTTNNKLEVVAAINEINSIKIGMGTTVNKSFGVTNGGATSYPSVFSFHDTRAAVTGVIKITLPFGWTNTNVLMDLKVKGIWNDANIYSILLSGFTNQTGSTWDNVSVLFTGTANTSRIVFAMHNGKCCIFIGSTATTWSKPSIMIQNLLITMNNTGNWTEGWNIELMTAAEYTAISAALTGVRTIG